MRVLVAYASRHGATQGIAERIAATLQRPGMDVTLTRADHVTGVDGYDAYVIGSAAYMGGWLGEATTFVRRNLGALAGHPVWLFSSGPTGRERLDAQGRNVLTASRPKEFGEFERAIHPRGMEVFFGAFDPTEPKGLAERLMSSFLRVMPAARDALPIGDFRDWPAIDAWAEKIAIELSPAPPATLATV